MKDLLIQTAKRTGLLDAEQLARYLDENQGRGRVDEILLTCPFYTEEIGRASCRERVYLCV